MENNFYVSLSSDQSIEYFPNNSATRFQVELDQPIDLRDNYECALIDLTCDVKNYNQRTAGLVYILSNVSTQQRIGETRLPVLRQCMLMKTRYQQLCFNPPYYIDARLCNVTTVEIYIKQSNFNETDILQGITTCTLHFRKKRWLV